MKLKEEEAWVLGKKFLPFFVLFILPIYGLFGQEFLDSIVANGNSFQISGKKAIDCIELNGELYCIHFDEVTMDGFTGYIEAYYKGRFRKRRITHLFSEEYFTRDISVIDGQVSFGLTPIARYRYHPKEKSYSGYHEVYIRPYISKAGVDEFLKFLILRELSYEVHDEFISFYFEEGDRLQFYKADSIAIYTVEMIREQEEQYHQWQIKEKERERQRVIDFYDAVFSRLTMELDPIEGVYSSIDQGEKYEYDIVILKSLSNELLYNAYVLSSTDNLLKIGARIFTCRTTASPDKYLVSYTTREGGSYDNKLATFDGALLQQELKSFIKTYPIGDARKSYSELNPLVDWQVSGSGIVLSEKGLVATNYHVVKGVDSLWVKMAINDSVNIQCPATLLNYDERTDVALLRIESDSMNSYNFITLELDNNPEIGEGVWTIGYPDPARLGENVKFNSGVVSGMFGLGNNGDYFQTDLPIWYGNSGGPCFNEQNQLLGLTTYIVFDDEKQKLENIGYVTKASNIIALWEILGEERINKGQKLNRNDLIRQSVLIKGLY